MHNRFLCFVVSLTGRNARTQDARSSLCLSAAIEMSHQVVPKVTNSFNVHRRAAQTAAVKTELSLLDHASTCNKANANRDLQMQLHCTVHIFTTILYGIHQMRQFIAYI